MNILKKQSTEERREMILNGNILKTLLFLSVPTLFVGIIQALVPLSDGLFLNNLGGVLVASSVSFSQPIINIMLAISIGLGVAAMSMIGQLYGKGSMRAVKEMTLQIFVFSFAIGIALIPICILSAFIVSNYTKPEIRENVFIYIALYSFAMPFNFLASIFNASKNAIGRPEITFLRIIILLVIKIICNTIFLYFFRLGIIGAVLATIVSYILITIWMFYDLFIKKSDMKLNLKSYKIKIPIVKKLVSLGFPSMISNMLVFFGFFLIAKEVERYGAIALNAQGIVSNINGICFILPASIGTTVTTMVSMNIGNGDTKKSKKIFYYGLFVSIVLAIIMMFLVIPFSNFYTVMFTREKEVLDIANRALPIYTYSVIGFGMFAVCQGVFISLGRTKTPLVMSILRIWLLRYIFILVTQQFLGIDAIFWANLFSNGLAGLIFFILVLNIDWTKNYAKPMKK